MFVYLDGVVSVFSDIAFIFSHAFEWPCIIYQICKGDFVVHVCVEISSANEQ